MNLTYQTQFFHAVKYVNFVTHTLEGWLKHDPDSTGSFKKLNFCKDMILQSIDKLYPDWQCISSSH